MTITKKERNRRLKLGIVGIVLIITSYGVAKFTHDVSGDWFKFSMLITGIIGWTEGCITLTDVWSTRFGK